ncbi:MAG: helix-turn-helix domain-containing protein [Spirochaetales bacterium]|nr:helix-turn-helix domain-containing protein [Spirochaetales bacterium]
MEIGDAIRKIRNEKGLSQEKVALDAGLSRRYIYMIESGKNNPTFETLQKLSKVLNVRTSEIVKLTEEGDHSNR